MLFDAFKEGFMSNGIFIAAFRVFGSTEKLLINGFDVSKNQLKVNDFNV